MCPRPSRPTGPINDGRLIRVLPAHQLRDGEACALSAWRRHPYRIRSRGPSPLAWAARPPLRHYRELVGFPFQQNAAITIPSSLYAGRELARIGSPEFRFLD